MNMSGSRRMALLQALALMLALAFISANAYAHVPVNSGVHAGHGIMLHQFPHEIDCDSPAAGEKHHLLHCHMTSAGAEAPGPVPSLDDDQSALVSRTIDLPTIISNLLSTLAVTRVPITGPPAFILFGNFRS